MIILQVGLTPHSIQFDIHIAHNNTTYYVASGFCCSVNEIFAVLGWHTVLTGR